VVASSAAALVSDRAYRPTPTDTSTMIFKKTSKNDKRLKLLYDFAHAGKTQKKPTRRPRTLLT
ncbi:hypothetical protein, partial [Sinorhizobium alkalisoli]|uniref:hypothetical protein n=1 Tax=Sinorhizobium alkalisoli TaxID=1752398 RepID=UPI001A957E9C